MREMATIRPRRRTSSARLALAAATLLAAGAPACAQPADDGSLIVPSQMTKLFSSKHPGATWILEHDDVFKLKPPQKAAMEASRTRFDDARREAEEARRAAFAKFKTEAGKPRADGSALDGALQALSAAELAVARATVDGHVAAFALLDAGQR